MITLVPESQFGKHLFEHHSVWARYDGPDEIDVIASWGIDRVSLLAKLAEVHDGNDHALYPVLRTDPLPEGLDLYIAAEFETPDGRIFQGCLSGPDALTITLFHAESQYPFLATGLSDLNLGTLTRLRCDIGNPQAIVFPLKFRTQVRTAYGGLVVGQFAAMLPDLD